MGGGRLQVGQTTSGNIQPAKRVSYEATGVDATQARKALEVVYIDR